MSPLAIQPHFRLSNLGFLASTLLLLTLLPRQYDKSIVLKLYLWLHHCTCTKKNGFIAENSYASSDMRDATTGVVFTLCLDRVFSYFHT